jgi:hypothetical protein
MPKEAFADQVDRIVSDAMNRNVPIPEVNRSAKSRAILTP